MSDVVQDIKDKLDIAEVIRSYIQLLPAGKNFKANCPFHKEKSPSFMVSPDRRTWHCFGGCNEGGDVISFVMKYENVEFYDALKTLAERAGIDGSRLRGSGSEYKKYDALYAVNEAAKNFFVTQLVGLPRDYCVERGLHETTIQEFEIGYAPVGSDALMRELVKKGFSMRDIEEAGLVFKTERGTYWDRFRGRIMFPIYSHVGKVVGFTGRTLPSNLTSSQDVNIAKYVNSPETPIFQKSKILYGFHKAKGAVREANAAVLVEGQMDFLMTYQSGVKNVVASSGTALSAEHLKTLRRLAETVILCFDNDEAGQKAIERSIDLALAQDYAIRVVHLSDKDPADIVRTDPGRMQTLIARAQPVKDFYFGRYLTRATGETGDTRMRGVRALLAKIKTISSPLEQASWIQEVTMKIGVGEHTIREEMERLPKTTSNQVSIPNETNKPKKELSRKELIVRRILELGGAPELAEYAPEYIAVGASAVVALRAALTVSTITPEDQEKELRTLVGELSREFYKERRAVLKNAIVQAQNEGDEKALHAALNEFDSITHKLHTRKDEKAASQSAQA